MYGTIIVMISRRAILGFAGMAAVAGWAAAQGMQVEAASTQAGRRRHALCGGGGPGDLAVLFAVIAIGLILGVLALTAAGVLLLVGVVSVSTLVAIATRSISAGMRVLLYQVFGLGGLLAGGTGGIVVHRMRSGVWGRGWVGPVVVGAIVGAVAAMAICWMFLTAIRLLIRAVRPEQPAERASNAG